MSNPNNAHYLGRNFANLAGCREMTAEEFEKDIENSGVICGDPSTYLIPEIPSHCKHCGRGKWDDTPADELGLNENKICQDCATTGVISVN